MPLVEELIADKFSTVNYSLFSYEIWAWFSAVENGCMQASFTGRFGNWNAGAATVFLYLRTGWFQNPHPNVKTFLLIRYQLFQLHSIFLKTNYSLFRNECTPVSLAYQLNQILRRI